RCFRIRHMVRVTHKPSNWPSPIQASDDSRLLVAVRRSSPDHYIAEASGSERCAIMYSVQPDAALQLATQQLNRVREEIGKIIVGQRDVVDGVLICLLAGGHVLLEGVPGLGKTTLLRTLARVLHLKYSRIQFTPDLMPADIVGSMIIDTEGGSKT